MDENAAWKQNELLKERMSHVTSRDIVKRIKKYYPHTNRNSSRGADVSCTYQYICYYCLGENHKPRYTIKEILLHLELTSTWDWTRLLRRHFKRCEESMIYLEKFLLVVKDLKKIDESKKKKIHEAINIHTES
jgi:hypothetical protein